MPGVSLKISRTVSLELCHFLHMFLKITSMAESGFGRTENTSSWFAVRNTVIGQWSCQIL